MSDPRIAWADIYLRAIALRCGNAFREPELEGLDFLMMLARDEIEKGAPSEEPPERDPIDCYIG